MKPGNFTKALLLALLAFVVSFLISSTAPFAGLELRAFDSLSRFLNPRTVSDNVVIVAVDQASIDAVAAQGITWPWPRQVYAPLVEQLSEADAVFIDILFTEDSSYGVDDDAQFAAAVRKAGNVYLPVFLTDTKEGLKPEEHTVASRINVAAPSLPVHRSFKSLITPVPLFASSAASLGNVMIRPDQDGIYRGVPLVWKTGDFVIPHFVLPYLMKKGVVAADNGGLSVNSARLPLAQGKLLLRYSTHQQPFQVISAADLIQQHFKSDTRPDAKLSRGSFKGKVAFIGLTAPGLYDLKPTAVSPVSTGIGVHATALDNLLHSTFITPAGRLFPALLMLALSLAVCGLVLRFYGFGASLAVFSGSTAMAVVLPALFFRGGIYVEVLGPLLSAVISFAITAAYSYATEGKQKRFIRHTFSQYMDRTLVDYVLQNPDVIKPGGRKQRVTVFFADIAGFTTLAEHLEAEKAALILHDIFNAFTEVIIRNQGVIDKYIGDCVMAFWGAPRRGEQDERNACLAALACMESLDELNKSFAGQGLQPISMRIGIHTGDAIAGNLGSDRLFDYTVVGDTVNLASRLESINKVFGTRIIVSEATIASCGGFCVRELGRVEVKGKTEAVRIFELAGKESGFEAAEEFGKGLEAFYACRWDEAQERFAGILNTCPSDGPSLFYLRQCELAKKESGMAAGGGIIRLTEK